jgi:predicted nuclease with TOPRIM domain
MSGGAPKRAGPAMPEEYNRLELAVRRLMDRYEYWRRRAETAERKVQELQGTVKRLSSGGLDPVELQKRTDDLAAENAKLRGRMTQAYDRVRTLVERFDFLEEER